MSATYWKAAAEHIARGLGEKTIRRLGVGGKFIGRAGAVVGIGFLAYELFKHYKRLVYVRQPSDPDLKTNARELAGFLDLALDIHDSDYSYLEDQLVTLLNREPE